MLWDALYINKEVSMGKKWCLALPLALLLAALCTVRAQAVEVLVEGTPLSGAQVRDGSTYVPLRGLLELLGGWELSWDGEAASAASPSMTLTVPVGDPQLLVNGYPVSCAPAFLQRGRTYVPLRRLAQLCGASVTWTSWQEPVEVALPPLEEDGDLYWLSRIISAESRGESLLGQLAVGAVVLNRVESEAFPDSIYDVIFEYNGDWQFEPVENGSVYLEPTETSILAARLCLSGVRVLEDCRYFFNPALSEGTWIVENRTYTTTIGCHQFYT